MKKRMMAFLLSCSMLFTTGCRININGQQVMEYPAGSKTEVLTEEEAYILPEVGETRHGFKVTDRGSIDYLKAETASFIHEKSGLTLFLIENDDPELAFQIAFRVPQEDGTDIAHIFEHSIISASDKYPGSNVFFDLVYKSYSSYVNAHTLNNMTVYPLASTSQEQLEKMMDVYMSCMEAPDVLKDERIFKREALRYQLYDKDSPIEMVGTVFSEDFGYLNQVDDYIMPGIGETLYPDTVAANPIGHLYEHYKELDYEDLKRTYEKYYSYDNAIILLYGRMDYDKELAFLDENYLGDEKREGKNAVDAYDLTPQKGFHSVTLEVPAFETDNVEAQSRIIYTVDLSGFSATEKLELNYLGALLGAASSPYSQNLKKAGIYNPSTVGNASFAGYAVDIFNFDMEGAGPEQAMQYYEIIQDTLKEVAENGFSESLMESVGHEDKLTNSLALEQTHVGITQMFSMLSYFMTTGRTDYYEKLKEAEKAFFSDEAMETMKKLSSKLLNAESSCLMTLVPVKGLAEKKVKEQEDYLAEMKEGMSDEEIEKLIADTLAFDEWNEIQVHNYDFLIDPKELPEPEKYPDVHVSEDSGIKLVSAPVNIDDSGIYRMYFDSSSITQEELYELSYLTLAVNKMNTKKHSIEELTELNGCCLTNLNFYLGYPSREGEEHNYPVLCVSWVALAEDFRPSLDLVMEILKETDFSDPEENLRVLGEYTEYYNPALQDPFETAQLLSLSECDPGYEYKAFCEGKGYYLWLKDLEKKLTEDKEYAEELADHMENVIKKVIGKTNLIFGVSAGEEDISGINAQAVDVLKELPANPVNHDVHYSLGICREDARRIGVYMDSSSQNVSEELDFGSKEGLKGRYYPFLKVLEEKYIVPVMRFQNGAYSAWIVLSFKNSYGCVATYQDPNVKKTLDFFDSLPELIKEIDISEEEFDGYIANAYSEATLPMGVLSRGDEAISSYIDDNDPKEVGKVISDIKNSTPEDLEEAADFFDDIFEKGKVVMAGNRRQMEPQAELFDDILDLQNP